MIRLEKNNIPFFTVIITTYNREELLKKAIVSLQKQTEKDWEAIIVDDGSTDNTLTYCRQLCFEDARFRYMFQQNRGVTAAKNAGLLAASGIYVTFLDSDDEYLPEHLELRKLVLLQYEDLDLLYGGATIIGDEFVPDANEPGKLINLNDCVIGGTFFIKRASAKELGGFPFVDYSEDSKFYQNALDAGMNVAKIDFKTYIYNRDSPDSICNLKRT